MTVLQAALKYANDSQHNGAPFELDITMESGRHVYGAYVGSDASHVQLQMADTGSPPVNLFVDAGLIEGIAVLWDAEDKPRRYRVG